MLFLAVIIYSSMNNFADEYKIGVQMKNEEYINPFSAESEMYARRLDEATITRDVKKLEILLNDIESILWCGIKKVDSLFSRIS